MITLPLFIRLCFYAFIKFKKPRSFNSKSSFKLRKGYAGLLRFSETIKPLLNFSTTLKQQRNIITYIVSMSILIEHAFDKEDLTLGDFREAIFENKKNDNPTIQKITTSIFCIKELVPNNSYHAKFLENIVRTWETHEIRDVKRRSSEVSSDEALQAAEDRGSSYFLALIYAFNPTNLNVKLLENIIPLSGAWFQIIDDYADRKKDRGEKNTPFTISQEKSSRRFKKYTMNYQKQIQVFISPRHSLIKFMKGVSVLWPIVSFFKLSDWH